VIENSSNRITDRTHDLLYGTPRLIRIRTIAAFLVRRLTDAADRRQWTIEYAYDLTECNFFRLFNKDISTIDPTSAGNESSSFECEKNLLQEFNGDVLASGNVVALKRLSMGQRELKQRSEAIFTFLREFHKSKVSLSTIVKIMELLIVRQGQSFNESTHSEEVDSR